MSVRHGGLGEHGPAARFLVPDSTVDKAGRTRARNATRGRSIPPAVRPERVDPPPVSCEQDEAEPRHRAINSRAASARRAGSPTSQRVGRKGDSYLILTNSTVSGNTASGNGLGQGGGIANVGYLALSGTTNITNNTCRGGAGRGGGLLIFGTPAATAAASNWTSSISGNTPDNCVNSGGT